MCIQKTDTISLSMQNVRITGALQMYGCYGNDPRYHFLRPITLKANFLGSDIPQTYALEVEYLRIYIR